MVAQLHATCFPTAFLNDDKAYCFALWILIACADLDVEDCFYPLRHVVELRLVIQAVARVYRESLVHLQDVLSVISTLDHRERFSYLSVCLRHTHARVEECLHLDLGSFELHPELGDEFRRRNESLDEEFVVDLEVDVGCNVLHLEFEAFLGDFREDFAVDL